jgi:GAF domain-containing protein
MDKKSNYEETFKIIKSVVESESDLIANMANTCAVLHERFNFLWTGFYLVKDEQLVLGPFQGPLACTRIPFGKGVCGSSWKEERTLVVGDVHQFPGHIACSSLSNSEIVVPLKNQDKVFAVLDIDSEDFGAFDSVDQEYLEKICHLLNK